MPTEAIPKRPFSRARIQTLQKIGHYTAVPTPLVLQTPGFVTSCWRSRSAGAGGPGRAAGLARPLARGERPCPAAIPPLFRARPGAGAAGAGLGLAGTGGRSTEGNGHTAVEKERQIQPDPHSHRSPAAPRPPGRAQRAVRVPQPRTGRSPHRDSLPVQRPPLPRPARPPRRLSPMRMRICFLPKRREKSEEMVRPMAAPAALGGGGGAPRGGEREGARPGRCAHTDPSARVGSSAAAAVAL